MQYVFNPKNSQINPVTTMTFVDPTLRDKVISPALYALVCKGKVSVADVAALFAVGKSPEILLRNHAVVKDNPITKAPAATATVQEPVEEPEEAPGAEPAATVEGAFDGTALSSKKQPELLIIAANVGCPELQDPDFAPTRANLMKAIRAKAEAALAAAPAAPAAPVV